MKNQSALQVESRPSNDKIQVTLLIDKSAYQKVIHLHQI